MVRAVPLPIILPIIFNVIFIVAEFNVVNPLTFNDERNLTLRFNIAQPLTLNGDPNVTILVFRLL